MEEFKVVKIIDDMNIVINCGGRNAVSIGDKFNIYSTKSEEVVDPVTSESLGEIRRLKATVKATIVYDKMCICQNAASKIVSAMMGVSEKFIDQPATLNVDPEQISGGLILDENEPIKIGDIVEKV